MNCFRNLRSSAPNSQGFQWTGRGVTERSVQNPQQNYDFPLLADFDPKGAVARLYARVYQPEDRRNH